MFIVYKEDIGDFSRLSYICKISQLPCFISPLHDSDLYSEVDLKKYQEGNNEDLPEWSVGDVKKPHWHVLVQMPYPKQPKSSLQFIQDNFSLLDINYIVPADFKSQWCRYFSHLDNPEKAQYDPHLCVAINGFIPDLTPPKLYKPPRCIRKELMDFISLNAKGLTLFYVIQHFNKDDEIIEYIERHTSLVNTLISDCRYLEFNGNKLNNNESEIDF